MGGSLSTLQREDDLAIMREELKELERISDGSAAQPTVAQQWAYSRHLASFKGAYARVVKSNATDSVALELLTRVTSLNAAWNKRVIPSCYDYETPH